MPRRTSIVLAALVLILAVSFLRAAPSQNIKPSAGYVPNEATAVAIAEAVMVPIWGEAATVKDRPYRATLADGVWTIRGTLPAKTLGGTAVVTLAQDDGRIVRVFREQ